MSVKKKFSLSLSALLLAVMLAGCGGRRGQTLKMNVTTSENSVWHVAASTFSQLVEENTNGRYRVEIYADEQLSDGDSAKGLENLTDGRVDLDLRSVVDMEEREARLSVLSLPWLFTSYGAVDEAFFNGPGREAVSELLRPLGLEPLAFGENGFRQVSNDVRPVTAPADFRGLRMRVPDSGPEYALFESFGAQPVPLDWQETFPALRDGGVDGQANAPDAIRSAGIHQVQRYLTVWNGSYDPICLSASAALWERLSEEDREIFRAAAREACAAEIAASRALDAGILSEFRLSGVEVTELTESQIQSFRDAAAPLYEAWRERSGGELLSALGYSG